MNFQEFKKIVHAGKEVKIKEGSYMYRIHRQISAVISWYLLKIYPGILPNHITVANVVCVLIVFLLALGENTTNVYWIIALQAILLNFTSVLDKVDGEISRYKKYPTQKGVYYDLIFHFLFPASFYFAFGYFFFILSDNINILLLSVLAGAIMSAEVASRKARHHVKYKLQLEGVESKIHDYITRDDAPKGQSLFMKLITYSIFFIYDWVWTFYAALVFISLLWSLLSLDLFVFHLILTTIFSLYIILAKYPRTALYTREEMNK